MRTEIKITRREFIRYALGLGLGITGTGFLTACTRQAANLGQKDPRLDLPTSRPPIELKPAQSSNLATDSVPAQERPPVELEVSGPERRGIILLTEARPILSEFDTFLQQNLPLLAIPTEASFASARIEHRLLVGVGLSELQADRINANLPAYLETEKLTGIPWKFLAALHRVETNFSTVNPQSQYGKYGPFQVTEMAGGHGKHVLGHENTFQEFVDLMVNEAVPAIRDFAKNVGVSLGNATTLEDWAKIAYAYNGMPAAAVAPDGKTYYGRGAQYYYQSGYVMNNYGENRNMYVKWWDGSWVQMKHDGFLRTYEKLANAEQAQGGIRF